MRVHTISTTIHLESEYTQPFLIACESIIENDDDDDDGGGDDN